VRRGLTGPKPATSKKSGRGSRRPGAGRKPVPRSEQRPNRVTVWLADDEFARLQAIADERGMYVGAVAYELVMDAIERIE
jgi:hypothetical protein